MATSSTTLRWWDYIDNLRTLYPGYVESLGADQLDRLRALAHKAADEDWRMPNFRTRVEQLTSYVNWTNPAEAETAPPEALQLPEEEDINLPGFPGFDTPQPAVDDRADVREILLQFLQENRLSTSLLGFIQSSLAANKPYSQIVAELRQTPEYKAAYPENDIRLAKGYDWRPEAEIRAYRSEARRLAKSYFNMDVSNEEIANLIGNDKSLAEWEKNLQTWSDFQRWGPAVRSVFQSELGYELPDDRVFAFLAPFIPTPELDKAYEKALLRGRPAELGLGIRPEEEAEILRQYGISPEQAFRGYQGIVGEAPRAERLASIEAEINRNVDQFPTGTDLFADTTFATLFRAIQLGDPEAIQTLQQRMSREVSRWQASGGPTRGGLAV
jgi:hypothetical protein